MNLIEASRKMTNDLARFIFPFANTTSSTDMENPVKEDLLSYFLPEELVLYVLHFLEMNDLGRCASVCSNWKRLADDDSLWMEICKERWEGKQTKAKWLNRFKYQDGESHKVTQGRITWKQLYFEAEQDATRTKITKEELCNIKWDFQFHGVPNHYQHPIFKDDHTFVLNSRIMRWRFVEEEEGEHGPQMFIQVDQYPFLSISRTDDWGWQLINNYVTFLSEGNTPADPSKKQKKEQTNRWWFLLPLQIAVLNDEEIDIAVDDLPEDLEIEEFEEVDEFEQDLEPERENENQNDM